MVGVNLIDFASLIIRQCFSTSLCSLVNPEAPSDSPQALKFDPPAHFYFFFIMPTGSTVLESSKNINSTKQVEATHWGSG